MRKAFSLAVSLLLAASAGAFGAIFTSSAQSSWYLELSKASLNPPAWVFAPVWTALYFFMALAAWRVWSVRAHPPGARSALWWYAGQLVLNAAWSWVFFGLREPLAAAVVILLLLASIIETMRRFYRIDPSAGRLFIPYVVWVAFATYLNLAIVILNP